MSPVPDPWIMNVPYVGIDKDDNVRDPDDVVPVLVPDKVPVVSRARVTEYEPRVTLAVPALL